MIRKLDRRFTRRLALSLAVLAAASTLAGCPGASFTVHSTWPNGRLSVLRGEADSAGERMGLWVYYAPDGSVQYERKSADGNVITATGVYEHGKRVRMPTSEELAAARVRADLLEQHLRRPR